MLESASALVIDASGLINLLAVQALERLVIGFRVPLVAARAAAREVVRDPRKSSTGSARIQEMVSKRLLRIVDLDAAQLDMFMSLVGAHPPDDIDDGEASTIACAHTLRCPLVLDDRKARRIVGARFPGLPVFFTVEVFLHCLTAGTLTSDEGRQAIRDACTLARMRIPFALRGRVSTIIGERL